MNPVRDKTSEMPADPQAGRVSNGMKLVIATPLYPPEIGGPATYAKLLEDGLPGKGIEVELVKFSEVRHLPKLIRHYAYYRRVLKAARGADAVLALDPVSVGLPAMQAARRAGKPFVVKVVGDYAWEQGRQRFGVTESLDMFVKRSHSSYPVRIMQRIQTRVARSAARVIVPSRYLKGIIEAWGIESEKIEVIYNAVPLEKPGSVPETVVRLPRPFAVTVGRLVPWKEMDGVINAVVEVPEFSLVIVGDGPLRTSLEAHGQKLGNRVRFTGQLSHADTLAVMQTADVLVLNSGYEGLSHVLIEAQAMGVPALATDAGGNPEVVTNGESGTVYRAGDTTALVQAFKDFLRADRRAMSAHALENAGRFSVEAMMTQTADIVKNV